MGGARPKALLNAHDKKYVAKFSSSTDITNVIKAEYIAMRLAKLCGIEVAEVRLVQVGGKDVLLIERFDRIRHENNWYRKSILSGLTLLGLDEMMARYASYEQLAWIIRSRFTEPKKQLRELFSRLVFNLICGNTDDHARNHAAFWDGKQLQLTPAYDLCPQNRAGNEASQAMLVYKDNNLSLLQNCLKTSSNYLLTEIEARSIIDFQIETVHANWDLICEEASLNSVDKNYMRSRQFLNSFIFTDYSGSH
ncbi:HipA domain-containing protein [Legionella shakespearei]|uniref:HipA domain-containing protein n=1 Tax=Legionella shakespearei TaxID=45075 RepID=UPI001ED98DE2|nr:HipA domain-containing protein [Legionella shakespearei]